MVVCSYCGRDALYSLTSSHLYGGRDYGPVWDCRKCDAYVGCNKRTGEPHGTLADKALRYWRRYAHEVFDPSWKCGKITRTEAYNTLTAILGLPNACVHIGLFDEEMCRRVAKVCSHSAWWSLGHK